MSEGDDMVVPLDGSELLARSPRVAQLMARAAERGVSLERAWLVGGAVRDAILGRDAGPDIDLAVEGSGHALARVLAAATAGEVLAEHHFGTATLVVDLGDDGPARVDVASCRTERYPEPGALPSVRPGATIEADLARRDVSVNAIAVALAPDADGRHRVVDPHDGIADIRDRTLRVLHDGSFLDDPTRIFRVARYAGRLGFRVEDRTRRLAIDAVASGALGTVSADRVREELQLVLREPAWEPLTLLASWGVVERLDPRLEAAFHPPLLLPLIDEACAGDPHLNDRSWMLRLAAIARPLGADAAGWMSWLGFPADVVRPAVEHLRVLDAVLHRRDELAELTNSAMYLELGELMDDSLALAALAAGDDPPLLQRLAGFAESLRSTRLTVRGDDVLAAGVPPGPLVGRILGVLFLRSLDGELQGPDDERRALAELVAEAQATLDASAGDDG